MTYLPHRISLYPYYRDILTTMDSADFSQFVVTMADEADCDTSMHKLQGCNLIQNTSIIFGREKGHPLIGCPSFVALFHLDRLMRSLSRERRHFLYIRAISLLTKSGASVFELCPAPIIHLIGMPVLLCQALL